MADELKKNKKVEEGSIGYTQFGTGGTAAGQMGPYFYPSGRLGQFLARFFATKAAPYMAKQGDDGSTPQAHLAGDTVLNADVVTPDKLPAMGTMSRSTLQLPEIEKNRRERYKRFEEMDDYPEIGTAFDIYADDSTQKNLRNKRWTVHSESQMVVDEVEDLFTTLKLDRHYWDIVRNTIKYGDCFMETILDVNNPRKGLQRMKVLNPNFIIRVENEYGYLTDFLQEIPEENDWMAFGSMADNMAGAKYISLDRNQVVHFRLRTSDPAYYPYGKSIAGLAIRVFRALKLMEDAMLIYRLARAPERRIFYIDVANMPATKAEMFIEKVKEKFKKEKYYNPTDGTIDARYNPLSADEDFFVPTRGAQGTKIETLPGAQNLGEVDDVRYFRDKLLAALKVPKDYIVEKDKSPERKANLSQLDAKFARVIGRVQQQIEIGLGQIARRHLALVGYPASLIKGIRIQLPDPSDTFTKRKMEIDEQKARVVQAVVATGLFPTSTIYKEFYDMTDQEIQHTKDELKKEQEEAQAQEEQQAGAAAGMDQAGADQDMERDQAGKDMDAARDEGGKQADHDRAKELQKETVHTRLVSTLNTLKRRIISESGDKKSKLLSLERIINRNAENHQKND
jgi:hypothetical protein|tara:strand:+ start:3747 stop:5615 length:1869 start_codon:yes stop_codon:yes gene_type:complete